MEIVLKQGDRISIPEGCKAVISDGMVVFEKEEREFKDGDILAHAGHSNYPCPFIYKGTDAMGLYQFYVGVNCVDEIRLPNDAKKRWGNGDLRYATDEEKQLLFDKMKEQDIKWNAEEKRVEPLRWRARLDEDYYYFTIGGLVMIGTEYQDGHSNNVWEFGNHFRTEEQAEKASEVVREALRKFHEENG